MVLGAKGAPRVSRDLQGAAASKPGVSQRFDQCSSASPDVCRDVKPSLCCPGEGQGHLLGHQCLKSCRKDGQMTGKWGMALHCHRAGIDGILGGNPSL